ncbi:MAG: class II D-tagatose-bisphosphate aldolase, non-catalytic subunit [Oscillospiraceae bacterium]|nr:class II D-tagatose-bisphosphate aldolase, non-catalytic subunit [Oscillospiraceae bacterium]MCL2278524.1 class II D-tagatose-bisphosphate aldolase, non-catalytic subunit [Oscillospiraceae bacterium]
MYSIQSIIEKHKAGEHIGIFANCSANEYVLRAVMRRCKRENLPALIEATANQVNQEGGYTGQTPKEFYAWCQEIAKRESFDTSNLILGGDHLGPLTWSKLSEAEAMDKAEVLVREYVLAGFTKIHIDTSMRLGSDDKSVPLSNELIAERGARLCAVAEKAFAERKTQVPDAVAPVYIVGSEVPIPGGAMEHEVLSVTGKDDCTATISAFSRAFESAGLTQAWERVVAVVVQPGVEFGEDDVDVYCSEKAKELRSALKDSDFVFEGHSTDYQPRPALRALVRDGIVILKVGPALTFALREALFALENIEKIALTKSAVLSRFSEVLESVMLEKPDNWISHYHGDEHKLKINRAYGFSDRARYYLPEPAVKDSMDTLISNLKSVGSLPLPLLSQFLPLQYARVRDGEINNTVDDIILDKIGDCIDDYVFAVR